MRQSLCLGACSKWLWVLRYAWSCWGWRTRRGRGAISNNGAERQGFICPRYHLSHLTRKGWTSSCGGQRNNSAVSRHGRTSSRRRWVHSSGESPGTLWGGAGGRSSHHHQARVFGRERSLTTVRDDAGGGRNGDKCKTSDKVVNPHWVSFAKLFVYTCRLACSWSSTLLLN